MKSRSWIWITSFLVLIGASTAFFMTGCRQGTSPNADSQPSAENKSDEELIKAQAYCPVQKENKLGSMGKPYKLMVKGQPVFLC